MIGYIKGSVAQINDNNIILDNNGIGYLINMPASSLFRVNEGMEVTVHTFMAFGKEDVSLCGFLTKDELEMFKNLLKVSGIGPKGAMNILSSVDVETLKMAIVSGDDKLISSSKGISAKTAQKIILELKGKVNKDMLSEGIDLGNKISQNSNIIDEAISVVVATGFDRTSCMKAVQKINISEGMSVDDLIDAIFANINV